MDPKETLQRYLRRRDEDLLSKLDGLGEYDVRRPMTGTGTNLLGLVKHVASVEIGYLGEVFGRPADRALPWFDAGAEPDADLWVPADESRAEIVELYRFAIAHGDETIAALELSAEGEVQWWPEERRRVTLHQILVHVTTEVARHAGHADIIRELIDGSAGQRPSDGNVTSRSADEWAAHVARVEEAAKAAGAAS